VLSTKVGRILDPTARGGWFWDFSAEGVRRSLAESGERLGIDRADILYVHSPGDEHFDQVMAETYPELAAMRARGEVKAIGCGLTSEERCLRFAQAGDWDCFLLAGRYTLLDQSALTEFLPYCVEHGISIVIGGPYNSGILASDLGPDALYNYCVASPEVLDRARRIRDVCRAHDVPLKAAALQFVLAHPAVVSVIPGSSFASHVTENAAMVAQPIPAALWDAMREKGLLAVDAPVPE